MYEVAEKLTFKLECLQKNFLVQAEAKINLEILPKY